MTDLTSNNLETICRLCLNQQNLIPIRESIVEGLEVSHMIEYSISLEVRNNDSMPSNICNSCLADLYRIYGFKKRCHDNDKKLRLLVKNVDEDIKLEIVESDIKVEIKESDNEDIGNKTFEDKTENLQRHAFWCSTCNQSFSTFQESLVHKRQERHVQFAPVCCKICDKTFERRRLATHMKTHDSDENLQWTVSNNGKNYRKQYSCSTCNKCFTSPQESLDHKKRERHGKYLRVFCELCGRMYEKARRSMHLEICQSRMKYKCFVCNVTFSMKHNLKRHIRIHAGKKDFICSVCGQRFANKDSLTNHEKQHKISLGTYQCPLCPQTFNRKSLIRNHMETIHPMEDPQTMKLSSQFSCKECGKTFSEKIDLQVHERLHTSERPYKCDFCDFRCRQPSHINIHRRVHAEVEPYSCPICGQEFATIRTMKSHMRIHGQKPYKCTDCGKAYSDSNRLKKHEASHLEFTIATESNSKEGNEEEYCKDVESIKVEPLYQLEEDENKIVL